MFGMREKRRFQNYRDPHPFARRAAKSVFFALTILLFFQLTRIFLFSTYRVDTVSMSPQYEPGNYILTSPLPYGPVIPYSLERLPSIAKPKRGDIVILNPPYIKKPSIIESFLNPVVRFFSGQRKGFSIEKRQEWENDYVVKRIIALPGDTVRMRGPEAYIKPKDTPDFVSEFSLSFSRYELKKEPLPSGWTETDPLGGAMRDIILRDNEYFVLGDNRSRSTDSRLWGPVRGPQIRAKVIMRYWPFGKNKKK
jgi:signal peptidase I